MARHGGGHGQICGSSSAAGGSSRVEGDLTQRTSVAGASLIVKGRLVAAASILENGTLVAGAVVVRRKDAAANAKAVLRRGRWK